MTAKHDSAPARIDRVAPEDWPRLRRVRLRALAADPEAFGSTFEQECAFPDARWRERLEDPGTVFFLAVADGADAGLARFSERDGVAGLFSMWVAPEHRGRGIGRTLVEHVAAEARSRGHARLFLEVVDANREAVRLYERCGFVPTGRTGVLPPPRAHVLEHERALDLTPAEGGLGSFGRAAGDADPEMRAQNSPAEIRPMRVDPNGIPGIHPFIRIY